MFLEQLEKAKLQDLEEFKIIYFAQSNPPQHTYWSSPKYILKLKDPIFGLNLSSGLAEE